MNKEMKDCIDRILYYLKQIEEGPQKWNPKDWNPKYYLAMDIDNLHYLKNSLHEELKEVEG